MFTKNSVISDTKRKSENISFAKFALRSKADPRSAICTTVDFICSHCSKRPHLYIKNITLTLHSNMQTFLNLASSSQICPSSGRINIHLQLLSTEAEVDDKWRPLQPAPLSTTSSWYKALQPNRSERQGEIRLCTCPALNPGISNNILTSIRVLQLPAQMQIQDKKKPALKITHMGMHY